MKKRKVNNYFAVSALFFFLSFPPVVVFGEPPAHFAGGMFGQEDSRENGSRYLWLQNNTADTFEVSLDSFTIGRLWGYWSQGFSVTLEPGKVEMLDAGSDRSKFCSPNSSIEFFNSDKRMTVLYNVPTEGKFREVSDVYAEIRIVPHWGRRDGKQGWMFFIEKENQRE